MRNKWGSITDVTGCHSQTEERVKGAHGKRKKRKEGGEMAAEFTDRRRRQREEIGKHTALEGRSQKRKSGPRTSGSEVKTEPEGHRGQIASPWQPASLQGAALLLSRPLKENRKTNHVARRVRGRRTSGTVTRPDCITEQEPEPAQVQLRAADRPR